MDDALMLSWHQLATQTAMPHMKGAWEKSFELQDEASLACTL
jgi:hypothetical protein